MTSSRIGSRSMSDTTLQLTSIKRFNRDAFGRFLNLILLLSLSNITVAADLPVTRQDFITAISNLPLGTSKADALRVLGNPSYEYPEPKSQSISPTLELGYGVIAPSKLPIFGKLLFDKKGQLIDRRVGPAIVPGVSEEQLVKGFRLISTAGDLSMVNFNPGELLRSADFFHSLGKARTLQIFKGYLQLFFPSDLDRDIRGAGPSGTSSPFASLGTDGRSAEGIFVLNRILFDYDNRRLFTGGRLSGSMGQFWKPEWESDGNRRILHLHKGVPLMTVVLFLAGSTFDTPDDDIYAFSKFEFKTSLPTPTSDLKQLLSDVQNFGKGSEIVSMQIFRMIDLPEAQAAMTRLDATGRDDLEGTLHSLTAKVRSKDWRWDPETYRYIAK